eukprot:850932-Prorocentrum_minimum.AAC.3
MDLESSMTQEAAHGVDSADDAKTVAKASPAHTKHRKHMPYRKQHGHHPASTRVDAYASYITTIMFRAPTVAV